MPGLTDLLRNPRRLQQFAETPGNYPAALEAASRMDERAYATAQERQRTASLKERAKKAKDQAKIIEGMTLETGDVMDRVQLPSGEVAPIDTPSGKVVKVPGKSNLFVDPSTGEPYQADPTKPTGLRSAYDTARRVARGGKEYAVIPGVGEREIGPDQKAIEKRQAENTRLSYALEKRPYNIDRVTGQPIPLQSDEEWAKQKQEKADKLAREAHVKNLKRQADLLDLDAKTISINTPKVSSDETAAYDAAVTSLEAFAGGKDLDTAAKELSNAPDSEDEEQNVAKATAQSYLSLRDKVKPAKDAEAKVKELELRSIDLKRQMLDPDAWKADKTASLAQMPDADLVAEAKAQADIITDQETEAQGVIENVNKGRASLEQQHAAFLAERQAAEAQGLSLEQQQALDTQQAQLEAEMADYDDYNAEAVASAQGSIKASQDRREVLAAAGAEIDRRNKSVQEQAQAAKEKAAVLTKAKPLYDWAKDNFHYTDDYRGMNDYGILDAEAKKAGLDPKQAREALQTYRQLDWSNAHIDTTTGKPLDEKARLLPDGNITVNPGLLLDPEAYNAAVDAAETTPEAKARAKAMRAELAAPVAAKAIANLRKNSDFAEWLDKNTTGNDTERMEQFNASMKEGGAINASLMKFLGSAAGLPSGWLGAIAGLTGSDAALEYARYWQDRAQAYQTAAGEAGKGTNMAGRFLASVAGGVPSVLESLAVGGAAGRVIRSGAVALGASAIDAAAQSGGSTFVDAVDAYMKQGLSQEEAKAKAAVPAIASGLVTGVLTALGSGGVESLLRPEGQALGRAAIKKSIKAKIGEGVSDEAAEEWADQMMQGIIAQLTYDPKKPIEQVFAEATEAGLVGGVLGGGSTGIQAFLDRNAPEVPAQPQAPAGPGPVPGPVAPSQIRQPAKTGDVSDVIKAFTPTGEALLPQAVADTAKRTNRTTADVARAAASGLVKVAEGASLESLDAREREALGFVSKDGKIVPASNTTPLVDTYKGKLVIRNEAAEWLDEEGQPLLARRIKLDEAERKAQIDAAEAKPAAKKKAGQPTGKTAQSKQQGSETAITGGSLPPEAGSTPAPATISGATEAPKPSQTITGSNAGTAAEMPVQPATAGEASAASTTSLSGQPGALSEAGIKARSTEDLENEIPRLKKMVNDAMTGGEPDTELAGMAQNALDSARAEIARRKAATITTPAPANEPQPQAAVSPEPSRGQVVPESRGMPVVPEQPPAPAQEAAPEPEPAAGGGLTPTQQDQLTRAEADHKKRVETINKMESDPEQRSKQLKAEGMRHAAVKRRITGKLTAKEQAAEAKREASNYEGKPVAVEGRRAVVTGNAFGKVKVRFEDGTTKTVPADQVEARPEAAPATATETEQQAPSESQEPETPLAKARAAIADYTAKAKAEKAAAKTQESKNAANRKIVGAEWLAKRLEAFDGVVDFVVDIQYKGVPVPGMMIASDGAFVINPAGIVNQIASNRLDAKGVQKAVDKFLVHEFIHKAALSRISGKRIIELYNALTPEAKEASRRLYLAQTKSGKVSLNEFQAAHEWFAQLIEARMSGEISNQALVEASDNPDFRDKLASLFREFVAALREIAGLVKDPAMAAQIRAEADAVEAIVRQMTEGAGLIESRAPAQAQPVTKPVTQAAVAEPGLDDADKALADAFSGLYSPPETGLANPPAASLQQTDLPRDRRDAMMKAASVLVDAGVKTPAELATRLDKLAPGGQLRQYSRAFWRLMTGFDSTLDEKPDWNAVYSEIDRPAQPAEQAAQAAQAGPEPALPASVTPAQAEAVAEEAAMPEPVKQAAPFDAAAAKGQKKFLLAEVAKLVKNAPRLSEMTQEQKNVWNDLKDLTERQSSDMSKSAAQELRYDIASAKARAQRLIGYVTIEIPGDGTFTILNEKGALAQFQKRADKFPVSQYKDDLPAKPTAQAPTAVPALKKPKTTADVVAAIYPMVSQDQTRGNITSVKGDGTHLFATDGRVLARVEQENGGGKGTEAVIYDEKGNANPWPEGEGVYDGNQVIPDDSKFQAFEIDAGRWFSLMSQARAVIKALPGEDENIYASVSIYRNPDGSLGVFASDVNRGDYAHNIQPEAKFLAAYNPAYIQTILRAARNLGHETVEFRVQDDVSPTTFRAPNAVFVLMPMRINGAAAYSPEAKKARTVPPVTSQPAAVEAASQPIEPSQEPVTPVAEPAPKRQSKAKPAKEETGIADFGEKLGGARKDKAATINEELTNEEIAGKTLSEIWPKSEIDSIEDDELAAYATALRDAIPTKPQKGYKLNVWVGKVKMVKELMRFAAEKGVPEMISMLRSSKYNLNGFADKIALLQSIPRKHWSRIGNVRNYPDAYRFEEVDGNMTRIPSPSAEAEVDGRRVQATNLNTLAEAVNAKVSEGKSMPKMQFEVRGKAGKWGINKKGDPLYRKLKIFENPKEALAYINSNYADLVAAWEDVKESDNVKETDLRKSENRPRTAEDWRKGKDATPEMFANAFGFRGVEFGNWVSQGKNAKERQGMMNEAYDALHDLASILNIPTKAISLNGKIGLGFGSRGQGWASAHYEPGNLVINLTKTRGAGSLAHELFHAFDHHFGSARGRSIKNNAGVYITNEPETRYVNEKTGHTLSVKRWNEIKEAQGRIYDEASYKLQKGVRPEVEEAFTELVKALDDSPMTKRARLNDKGKKDYWGSTIERAARSFENYVIYKMQQKGYQNDYLANVVRIEDFVRNPNRYPYLLDEEIEPVAKAFDDLFVTIKTRETETGVELYNPPGEEATGLANVGEAIDKDLVEKTKKAVKAGRTVGTSNPTTAKRTGQGTDSDHNVELDRLRQNNPLAYRQNALILTRYPVVAKNHRDLYDAMAKADAPVKAAAEEIKQATARVASAQNAIRNYVAKINGLKAKDVKANAVNAFVATNFRSKVVKDKQAAELALSKARIKAKKASETQTEAIEKILSGKAISEEKAKQVYEDYITAVESNLLTLIELFPQRLRDVARLWYDGANIIAQKFSKQYGATLEQASGVLAVFSPQKDWFMNVSLAQRMMNIWANDQDTVWSPEMTKQFIKRSGEPQPVETKKKGEDVATISTRESLISEANPEGIVYQHGAIKKLAPDGTVYWEGWDNKKAAENVKVAREMLPFLEGKTLREITENDLKARFIRILSEVRDPSAYPIVTPDGRTGALQVNNDKVTLSKVAWGGYNTIEKAIAIMSATPENEQKVISDSLGDQHKVRSFYNNIVDPANESGHVTMDTHAIAAIHWMPYSGSSLEVIQNFGGGGVKNDGIAGIKGTYAANAEAYRRAGIEFNLLPREVQSITWEAVRLLFPKEFKTKNNVDKVRAVWNKFLHGEIDIKTARAEIFALATTSKDFPKGKDIGSAISNGEGLGDTAWAAEMGVGVANSRESQNADDAGAIPERGGSRGVVGRGNYGRSATASGGRTSAAMVRPASVNGRGVAESDSEAGLANPPGAEPAVTPAQDAEYLAAFEAGDSGNDNLIQLLKSSPQNERKAVFEAWVKRNPKAAAKAQRMVDEAAKAAGYDVGPVWHGSPDFIGTEFSPDMRGRRGLSRGGFSFTRDKSVAQSYMESGVDPFQRLVDDSNELMRKLQKRIDSGLNWKGPWEETEAPEFRTDALDSLESFQDYLSELGKTMPKDLAAIAEELSKRQNPGSFQANPKLIRSFLSNPRITKVAGKELLLAESPSQIKSADPVTYDENGNVIPLSQRFNPASPSTLYNPPGDQEASVPIQITRDMRQRLYDLGYSKAQVNAMKPAEAQAILAGPARQSDEAQAAELEEAANEAVREAADVQETSDMMDQLRKDAEAADALRNDPEAVAAVQASGAMSGRNLSQQFRDPAAREFYRALTAARDMVGGPATVVFAEMRKWAAQQVQADPDNAIAFASELADDRAMMRPEEQAVVGAVIEHLNRVVAMTGDKATRLLLHRIANYYLDIGTLTAQTLAGRRDPLETPQDRWNKALTVIFGPDSKVRRRLALAPTAAAKARRIAELEAQIAGYQAGRQADIEAALTEARGQETQEEILERSDAANEKLKAQILKRIGIMEQDMTLSTVDRYSLQTAILELPAVREALDRYENGRDIMRLAFQGRSDSHIAGALQMNEADVAKFIQDVRNGIIRPALVEEVKAGNSWGEMIRAGFDSLARKVGLRMASVTGPLGTMAPPLTQQEQQDIENEVNRILNYALQPANRRNKAGSLIAKVIDTPGGRKVRVFVPFDPEDMASFYAVAREFSAAKASLTDKVYEYWINWPLLSGPQTQVANISGNAANVLWHYTAQRMVEAAMNVLYRDPKSAKLGEFKHVAKAFIGSIMPSLDMARQSFLTEGDSVRHKYLGEPMEIEFKDTDLDKVGGFRPSIGGKAGKLARLPGRLLRFTDAFFKTSILHMEATTIAYRAAAYQAKQQGLTGRNRDAFIESTMANALANPGSQIWQEANKTAEELLFQDDNAATDFVDSILGGSRKSDDLAKKMAEAQAAGDYETASNLRNRIFWRKVWHKITRIIFPFQRTPTNIIKVGLRKAGGSAVVGLWHAARAGLFKIKDGEAFVKNYTKAMQIKDVSESLLAGLGWMMLASMFEGDDDDEKKPILIVGNRPYAPGAQGEREAFLRSTGGANSILFRDKDGKVITSFNFSRYEPVATLLSAWVDGYRNYMEVNRRRKQGEPDASYMRYIGSSLLASVEGKSFLQGFSGMMETIRDFEERRDPTTSNWASKQLINYVVPNLIKQPLRNWDDLIRDAKTAGIGYTALPNPEIAPKLPEFSAEPKITATGERIRKSYIPAARLLFQANAVVKPQPDALLLRANRLNPAASWYPQPLQADDYYVREPGAKRGTPGYKKAIEDAAAKRRFAELDGKLYADAARQVTATATPAELAKPNEALIEKFKKAREQARAQARLMGGRIGLQKTQSQPITTYNK